MYWVFEFPAIPYRLLYCCRLFRLMTVVSPPVSSRTCSHWTHRGKQMFFTTTRWLLTLSKTCMLDIWMTCWNSLSSGELHMWAQYRSFWGVHVDVDCVFSLVIVVWFTFTERWTARQSSSSLTRLCTVWDSSLWRKLSNDSTSGIGVLSKNKCVCDEHSIINIKRNAHRYTKRFMQ